MRIVPSTVRWLVRVVLAVSLPAAAAHAQPTAPPLLDTEGDSAIALLERQGRYAEALSLARQHLVVQRRESAAADARLVSELQERFSLQEKSAENRLLRAQEEASRAGRQTLAAALLLALAALLGAGAFVVGRQRRQSRACEEAYLARSRLLAAASHDLREPLHALNLYLAGLHASGLGATGSELVTRARSCGGSMAQMLHWLLEQSRLGTTVPHARIEDFPLAAVLDRTRERFEPLARARGLNLKVRTSDVWIRSDPHLVQRMVDNLVANAVRYTQRGGVLVGCRRLGSRHVRLAVYDTGPGVEPDRQEIIFAEGVRASRSAPPNEGLGLGLAIVKRLASQLDVPVMLHSRVGVGSVFALDLPRSPRPAMQAASDVPSDGQAHDVPTPAGPAPLEGRLALVLDADEAVRAATANLLMHWGAEVAAPTTPTDPDAIAGLCPGVPDVIITEHWGSGPHAVDVLGSLGKAWNRCVPALIVTADTTPETLKEIARQGHPVLEKPASSDALLEMVLLRIGKGLE